MTPALEFALIGMKASMDQLQSVGEQMAHLVSDNNLVEDMVKLTSVQRSFEANAAVASASDQVLGLLVDILI